jgi:hypothetical protein
MKSQNIPYTVRKERLDFFNNNIQKVEIDKLASRAFFDSLV